jgi:hypothetical protein
MRPYLNESKKNWGVLDNKFKPQYYKKKKEKSHSSEYSEKTRIQNLPLFLPVSNPEQ